jgi:hypothetical protein
VLPPSPVLKFIAREIGFVYMQIARNVTGTEEREIKKGSPIQDCVRRKKKLGTQTVFFTTGK